jgi:hypothetical protein
MDLPQARWKAATASSELIPLPPDSALWPWQPKVCYFLLDIAARTTPQISRKRPVGPRPMSWARSLSDDNPSSKTASLGLQALRHTLAARF